MQLLFSCDAIGCSEAVQFGVQVTAFPQMDSLLRNRQALWTFRRLKTRFLLCLLIAKRTFDMSMRTERLPSCPRTNQAFSFIAQCFPSELSFPSIN